MHIRKFAVLVLFFVSLVATGISVFGAVVPIPHTTIAHNRVSNEHFGVFTVKALKVSGLPTNKFAKSVDVPVAVH